ncbi:MAG: DNA helicase, partial [Actinobacteria bacterium]|nr:DNA helicase [Actinomycetota bacterium]
MSLSRKRQKELRQLQSEAAKLWASQQVIAGDAANVAREAGRQLDNFRREQVVPAVQDMYEHRVVPVVDKGLKFSRDVVDHKVVPAIGGVVGSALTAWDIANAKRTGSARAPRALVAVPAEAKSGPGIGSVIAIILGVA